MNSQVAQQVLDITSPTLDYKPGGVGLTPIPADRDGRVEEIVGRAVDISKADYDQTEISWDFKRHPLV